MVYGSTIAAGLWNPCFRFKPNVGIHCWIPKRYFTVSKRNLTSCCTSDPPGSSASQACQDTDVLTVVASHDNHVCSFKPKVAACFEKGFITSNPVLPHPGRQLEIRASRRIQIASTGFKEGLSFSHHAFRKEDYLLLVQCAGYLHCRGSAGLWTVRRLGQDQHGLWQDQFWLVQWNGPDCLQVFSWEYNTNTLSFLRKSECIWR